MTFNVTDGYQTIEPINVTVTITEHSGRFTYDANAHTVSGYDVSISNPLYTVNDFVFSGNASVRGTNAGTYPMNLRASDFTNVNANFADVTFVIVDGQMVIDARAVRMTADSKSKIYGEADPVLTVTPEGLAGTDYIVPTLTREEGENVGEYTINMTVTPNPNYIIEIVPGTLTIQPKAVTVTADDKVKVYGEADPELTVTISGLVEGEGAELIDYTLNRWSGDDVGDYVINATGDEAQGNYAVTFVPGTMTILPEDTVVVSITGLEGSFLYDGEEKDVSGYTVAINNALYTVDDFTFGGSSELKATNAGTYKTEMKAADFTNNNTNFENVVFVVKNGTLTINKRNVTLTSGSATKPYDGTPLTNGTVTVEGDGFVDGEGMNPNVTGRITQEGSTENTFTYELTGSTLAGNYSITTHPGTLTITKGLTHKLTIHYTAEYGEEFSTFTREYANGEAFSVASPKKDGYEMSQKTVEGTMGGEDIEITVVYRPVTYTLTVTFESTTDGKAVADPITRELQAGETYRIEVPAVNGYTGLVTVISGEMPAANRQVTVFMKPVGATTPGGADTPIELEDYGTPLGVADSILGNGESVE